MGELTTLGRLGRGHPEPVPRLHPSPAGSELFGASILVLLALVCVVINSAYEMPWRTGSRGS